MNVKNEGIKKMNIKVSNLDDANRNYDITANVWVNGNGEIENVEDGAVNKDDRTVATFARFSGSSHKTFIDLTPDEEDAVSAEIRAFVDGAKVMATNINL